MLHPPDPQMQRGGGQGTPNCRAELKKSDQTIETALDFQAPSALDLQIFCLARRFSLHASVAEAVAILVYGGPHR